MSMEKDSKKKRKTVYIMVGLLFLIGFLVCTGILIRDYVVQKKAIDTYEDMVKPAETQVTTTETVVTESEKPVEGLTKLNIAVPELGLEWNKLFETNEDIYSWIYIPNTNVNYPVLQHPTEADYYLDRNVDHSKGYPGCIYTQNMNAKDYSDFNTVLYGHDMKDGSMFKTLHYFGDESFFKENRYIFIYTPERVLVYEIYGAIEFSDAHLLYKYDNNEEGAKGFLRDLEASKGMKNHVMEDMELPEDTKLITLSTCITGRSNRRWLVVGVLLGEGK